MTETKTKFKEKIAYCGTRFLTGLTAVTVGLSAAVPLTNIPQSDIEATIAGVLAAATLLGAAAKYVGRNEKKPKWLGRVQDYAFGLAFCGAAALKSLDPFLVTQDRVSNLKTDGGAITSLPPSTTAGNTVNFADWAHLVNKGKAFHANDSKQIQAAKIHGVGNGDYTPDPANDSTRHRKIVGERA